jgi:hypothetical protein
MKRRAFVKSALAAASLAGIGPVASINSRADDNSGGKSQYFELRTYTFAKPEQQKLIDDYWRNAAIPALNRLGVKPIGAFTELEAAETTKIYILIPYDSLEAFASAPAKLAADAEYLRAGADYLDAPKSSPAYSRFESSLSVAFEGQRKLEVPEPPSEKPRVFELRTYESHSESKGNNKVLMFNSGEIPLMHETGLGPVFFGQSLVGARLPNLVYMVSGADKEEHKKHWKAFFDAPTWKKLIGDPQYKDNVSKVVSVFLKRAPYSQV